ncbi:Uu.00g036540.m01.CDS01 [Anthostomella pinea]|uniref:Uu.00g036540.m01.CDS01 n=1 Tax=Anthostomella pinea TaxID=933095 RepID=A0AAI8VAH1_9PEZI|nr:Uu.00g036540.m01.CDS01 [Anthostomella pinea]
MKSSSAWSTSSTKVTSAPDATINFNEACKKKHPRTGLWLVHGDVFHDWLRSARSFLWLRGFAGCGKSVLLSTAIQYAFRHRRSHPRTGIAFFFFTFNDESKQDASALLRALILQLSMQLDNHNDLSRLQGSYRHASPPDEALLGCLHQLVRAFQDVYILVDALDESPRNKHREVMLQVIKDMRGWEEPGLHLLVTSRDEVDIREELDAKPEETIEIKNIEVDRDVAIFVAQNLQDNRRYRKWQRYSARIEKALTERANGVFRWVECQLKALAACPANQHLLHQLLQSLPQSLDDTYARMLRNIAPELREYAQQMLNILCCAIRPLTDLELIDALAVELGDQPRFDITRRFEDVHDLEAICPGFIEASMDLGMQTTVRIAHFSVQEYLEFAGRFDKYLVKLHKGLTHDQLAQDKGVR